MKVEKVRHAHVSSISSAVVALCAAFIAAVTVFVASPGAAQETVREPGQPVPQSGMEMVNYQRALGNIAPVTQNEAWSADALLHSQYVVKTGKMTHFEDRADPNYTEEGDRAGRLSIIASSSSHATSEAYLTMAFVSAPFHAVGLLDPRLAEVGYGIYREDAVSDIGTAITIDNLSGNPPSAWRETEPVVFPADGKVSPILSLNMTEWPSPVASCRDFTGSPGAPIYVMTPEEEGPYSVRMKDSSGQDMEVCTYDGKTYKNPVAEEQRIARRHLDDRNTIVIIPKQKLMNLSTYTVAVTTCDREMEWSFGTAYRPETYTAEMPQEISAPRSAECDAPPEEPDPPAEPNAAPTITARQSVVTTSTRPVLSAVVRDRDSELRRSNIVVKLDGKTVTKGTTYDVKTDRLTVKPIKPLKRGIHRLYVQARDSEGALAMKTITVKVR